MNINKYLHYLNEELYVPKPKEQLFHGSPKNGLKRIEPLYIWPKISKKPIVWGTWYKPFAAIFTLPQHLTEYYGNFCDKDTDPNVCRSWTAVITHENEEYLKKPCSIYIIEPIRTVWKFFDFEKSKRNVLPEVITEGTCKVIKEERYKTTLECCQKNKVGLVYDYEKTFKLPPKWKKINHLFR